MAHAAASSSASPRTFSFARRGAKPRSCSTNAPGFASTTRPVRPLAWSRRQRATRGRILLGAPSWPLLARRVRWMPVPYGRSARQSATGSRWLASGRRRRAARAGPFCTRSFRSGAGVLRDRRATSPLRERPGLCGIAGRVDPRQAGLTRRSGRRGAARTAGEWPLGRYAPPLPRRSVRTNRNEAGMRSYAAHACQRLSRHRCGRAGAADARTRSALRRLAAQADRRCPRLHPHLRNRRGRRAHCLLRGFAWPDRLCDHRSADHERGPGLYARRHALIRRTRGNSAFRCRSASIRKRIFLRPSGVS